jgi:hypothetical protein
MNDHSAPEFWDKYIAIARLYKVRDNALRWYVRHAERYIANFEDLPPGEHEAKQVEAYLRQKGRNPDIESWQYRQIVQAIEILFSKLLKSPWAESFPWRDWDASAQTIPIDHATLSRSYRPLEADATSTDGGENSSLSRQVLTSALIIMRSGIHLRRIYWKTVMTSERFRSCWGTQMYRPR